MVVAYLREWMGGIDQLNKICNDYFEKCNDYPAIANLIQMKIHIVNNCCQHENRSSASGMPSYAVFHLRTAQRSSG